MADNSPTRIHTFVVAMLVGLRDGGHHHNVTRWANGVAALGRANVVTESPHLVCLLPTAV